MQRLRDTLIVSPSDLVGHLACGHLTALERAAVRGEIPRPERDDPALDVLSRRGLEHESAYLETLRARRLRVTEIAEPERGMDPLQAVRIRAADTLEAMRAGVDVIFQATFLNERDTIVWRGHADFLRKVPGHSALGDFHYEPEDTKLARTAKPSAVLQLCHYAEHIERLQSRPPENVHVILGGKDRMSFRFASVAAYYRAARERFLRALRDEPSTYPLPVRHCAVCRWIGPCRERWEKDDHLCRVANLSREQGRKLEAAGVGTLEALAASDGGLAVRGIGAPVLRRLQRQARLQRDRAPGAPPPVERLPALPGQGLSLLPEPTPGDVFYDIEGDPHVGSSGLEYLHGVGWIDGGAFRFRPFWAHTPAEERRSFEALIDWIVDRRARFPGMHVYHYAPYETAALGRLMGRYGTREAELDDLLRGGVFVDLYRVVRQGLAVGSPSYSLKMLEPLYMPARSGAVVDAASSIVEYERWLQREEPEILREIEEYNREDVESTWRLRDWLETVRAQAIEAGDPIGRPPMRAASASDAGEERPPRPEDASPSKSGAARASLVPELLDGQCACPPADDPEARARWVMAHLLYWHQREAKPEWWMYFQRILRHDEADFYDDTEAIAGLEPVGEPVPVDRSLIWTYHFDPKQEFKLREGAPCLDPEVEREKYWTGEPRPGPGTVEWIDPRRGRIALRRSGKSRASHPRVLIPAGPIDTSAQEASLLRVAEALDRHGLKVGSPGDPASWRPASAGMPSGRALPSASSGFLSPPADSRSADRHSPSFDAARRLLGNLRPRIAGVPSGVPLRAKGEDLLAAAIRLARCLDGSVLPIQGPPGSGKTFTAARLIVQLVADGRTVGITANSHAVISNLLNEVLEAVGDLEGRPLRILQKSGAGDARAGDDRVVVTGDNGVVERAIAAGTVDIVAGTSWLFSREGMLEKLDTLVVDEAGQLSLANVIAVSAAARNLILVGDPRQLSQPSKGTHPEGVGVSALEHVLGDDATIPVDRGLFLDRSRRMHPDICGFISEQIYDGRLESVPGCERQRIHDGPVVQGSGIRWLPVEHEGNRTSSVEEVEAVARLFETLIGRRWTNVDGATTALTPEDILVVAPYNAQVSRITERLPHGARVGTVDRFQGRQAPVVLVSLTASSAEEVPRGMEFLYSRNRLNVAVSRAQALCVVAGSPELLAVHCRSTRQMELVNVLCRYVEKALAVDPRLLSAQSFPSAV